MNSLKFVVIPNPFKDQEYSKYDYLGKFVINGTKTLSSIAETIVVGRPHLDAEYVSMIVGLLFDVIADEIADNYRCSLCGFAFASAISGSFPAANSSFSEDNELYVSVTIGDPLRSTAAALAPEKDSDESVKIAINNVEDKTSHEVGVIHGTNTAIVTGKNMSATQTGESIVLADLDTFVTKSIGTVVAQDGIGQRLEVNFAAPIAKDTYWLVLKTRGYSTPDAEVGTYRKKVIVNPGATPTHEPEIVSVQGEGEAMGTIAVNASCTLGGHFESWVSGNVLKLKMAKKASAGGGYVETDAFSQVTIGSDYTTATAKVPNYTESLGDLETTGAEVIWYSAEGGTVRTSLTNVNVSLP